MQVIQFFQSQDIVVNPINLALVMRSRATIVPSIIIRFVNRKNKVELLKQWKKLKGTDVYMKERFTQKNAKIARQARLLRKQKKTKSTWTRNCRVLIKLIN